MPLYFAYGSNMSAQQMVTRCPSARFVSVARLTNHALVFPRLSRRWGGGAAGIEKALGESVEGVLFEISDEDLEKMDGFEGVADDCYWRKTVAVTPGNGDTADAEVYYAFPQKERPFPPHPDYLERLVVGAKEHGLSADYVAILEGIETI